MTTARTLEKVESLNEGYKPTSWAFEWRDGESDRLIGRIKEETNS